MESPNFSFSIPRKKYFNLVGKPLRNALAVRRSFLRHLCSQAYGLDMKFFHSFLEKLSCTFLVTADCIFFFIAYSLSSNFKLKPFVFL